MATWLVGRLAAAHRAASCAATPSAEVPTDSEAGNREGHAVELAVGRRPEVAADLATRGFDVLATDVHQRAVPPGVTFVQDDLTAPDVSVYAGATLLYARNLPAELQRPARDLARTVGAPLYFTTLGTEEPVVPVEREMAPVDTLYRATSRPAGR